VTPTNKKSQV